MEIRIFSHDEAYSSEKLSKKFIDDHAEVNFPEGFRQRLEGKTLEEQMKLFAFVENVPFVKEYYHGSGHLYQNLISLEDCRRLRGIIVEDGIIEGVMIQDYNTQRPAGPYDAVTTFIGDNNNDCRCVYREDIITLICLPEVK